MKECLHETTLKAKEKGYKQDQATPI